jgi:predicted nucleotidyltransferase
MTEDHLEALRADCDREWSQLAKCEGAASTQLNEIEGALDRVLPADTAFVAFGSLARGEWTDGSDLDWTLLVDGQANRTHLPAAQAIRSKLEDELKIKPPGPSALFGGPSFSHELIHRIGGDADSNRNTTRRILLLLESVSLEYGREVRERVLRQLVRRYIDDDHGYRLRADLKPYVPGLLLNDFVRFWRTMAVDFASKRLERQGEGWALRRFKLRMSRKLLFLAGLAACLSCKLRPSKRLSNAGGSDEEFCGALTEELMVSVDSKPLQVLAGLVREFQALEAGRELFGAYDEFLMILADTEQRTELEGLDAETASTDPLLQETDRIAKRFRDGALKLFFDTDTELTKLTQQYGVF